MPSPSLSLTVSLSLYIFVSLLLKPLQALSPPSSSSSNLPLLLLPISNLTTSSTTNTSSSENPALRLHCTGEHFGFNPNIADCESAKEHITPDSVQYTWGARHTGLGPTVIPLPYRIMGNRALCFFQTLIPDNEIKTAHASLGQIRRAASALILQCAAGGESQGGMASNIGMHSTPSPFSSPKKQSGRYTLLKK